MIWMCVCACLSVTEMGRKLTANKIYLKAVVNLCFVESVVSYCNQEPSFLIKRESWWLLIPSLHHLPNIFSKYIYFFQSVCWHSQYYTSDRLPLFPSFPCQKSVTTNVEGFFFVKMQPISLTFFLCCHLAVLIHLCIQIIPIQPHCLISRLRLRSRSTQCSILTIWFSVSRLCISTETAVFSHGLGLFDCIFNHL